MRKISGKGAVFAAYFYVAEEARKIEPPKLCGQYKKTPDVGKISFQATN